MKDMLAPKPVHLPALEVSGTTPAERIRSNPLHSESWADLSEAALDAGRPIEAYAYARTGYHRGLDQLRANGWKGFGPVPWSHGPNRGVLRSIALLGRAAREIGETAEYDRCLALLQDCDQSAVGETGI
ncbi:DUF3151 domain-containing protein [Corynebacterium sp. TAE3-ERU12]|uniref:DUF3151 domain-containing protein n=1 Tax=Corynebacterium sp. TAE3-ERU12 TaxID=2849491 RepID=UPI00351D98A1